MFFLFSQNNSGGYFVETDELCHRLFIEADSEQDAIDKAEDLGCYWNGVAKGKDCPCCGDRWYGCDEVKISIYRTNGCEVSVYDGIYGDTVGEWEKRYGKYNLVVPPRFEKTVLNSRSYKGTIRFDSIEEYAQYLADEYGHWTKPDGRIYYKDGTVKEIFTTEEG